MSTAKYNDEMLSMLEGDFLTNHGWQDFTPTITQGVTITVSAVTARFIVLGNTVHMRCFLDCDTTGTAAQPILLTNLPTVIRPTSIPGLHHVVGVGMYHDSGTTVYPLNAKFQSSSNSIIQLLYQSFGGNVFGQSPAVTVAAGDQIGYTCTWER